ncbi:hypothetical protein CYMTET_38655 [Cymbomonas tetramitiformis]|uniref:Uncharacterized protein n=1 Tax=Cymbomonas tetramitiformis TaxID=36881 RepID=A0AAE0CBK3_9CHLO|nr:hypothetical protein CYMTET_38655 [Cymbomonas tetramitiformis]
MQESGTAFAHILLLVSRGQALLAELFRLSDKVPPVFNPELEAKYAEVLFDFRYLKATEYYESKLESETRLLELDDEFRENNLPILERFFQLFEGIIRYYQDLMRFLEDLQEGMYIQQTFEGLLTDPEGKQLIVEAFYLHGALLQLLDLRIDPLVKERMVISFYRFKGATDIPNIDDVIKMCRATGHTAGQVKQTHGYPEQYFARFPLPVKVVRMVLGRIRLDDVYNQIRHYPNPEHRSTALAQQAAYLYILLYFVPDILHDETAVMREIVDKHYVDNWVIPFSLGHTVDLSVEWKPYQAAKLALDNVITPSLAKKLQFEHVARLPGLLTDLASFLTEGVLTEEFILCNHDQILGTLRNCNVAIQWLMLHRVLRTGTGWRVLRLPGDSGGVLYTGTSWRVMRTGTVAGSTHRDGGGGFYAPGQRRGFYAPGRLAGYARDRARVLRFGAGAILRTGTGRRVLCTGTGGGFYTP